MRLLALPWWSVALRGVVALLFGVVALLRPGLTLASFVLLFGGYAAVDGALGLAASFRSGPAGPRVLLALGGLASLTVGSLIVLQPDLSAVVLLYVLSAWAIVSGVAAVGAASALRETVRGAWLHAAFGLLSITLGIFLVTREPAALRGLFGVIAGYAVAAGAMLIALGAHLRLHARRLSVG